MKHRTLWAVCLLFALVGVDCKKSEGSSPQGSASGGGAGGRRGGKGAGLAFAVDTMDVESKKLTYAVTAPGTVEAFERVQVTARVAGIVDKVAFTEGQDVKKGDTLVLIEGERFRLAVNSAKAALDKAQANQKDIEAMIKRREGASDKNPGLIPGEELETYRTRGLTAKADSAVASEALKVAELNLRDSAVRAPMEGVIQTRTVETGQFVQAGAILATLLRNDPLLLRFQVEPSEAVRLKAGMNAAFTMRETQRAFTAAITLVAGAADPTTHMVVVTAQVKTDEHRYWLRPGSFCDVTVDVGAGRDAPVIPRSAVRATDHGQVAYVIEGDVAKERVLTLGMNTKDGWVEVRSGLAAGEKLVIRGAEALTTGAKVIISKQGPPAPTATATAHDGDMPAPQGTGAVPAAAPSGSGSGRGRRGAP